MNPPLRELVPGILVDPGQRRNKGKTEIIGEKIQPSEKKMLVLHANSNT